MNQFLSWLNQTGPVQDPSDVTFVVPGIALTNMGPASNLSILKKLGIRSILSLYQPEGRSLDISRATTQWVTPRIIETPQILDEAGVIRREVVPLTDDERNSIIDLKRVVDLLAELHRNQAPVLVHCRLGVSRTPAIVAAYLAKTEGLTFKTAVDRIAEHRSIAISEGLARTLVKANGLIIC